MAGPAPIYSVADQASQAESSAWAQFSSATDGAEFWTSWLTLVCLQIERVGGGLLLLDRRPVLAGILFGALCYKPHFGMLIPVALAASGRWRAFGAAAASAAASATHKDAGGTTGCSEWAE